MLGLVSHEPHFTLLREIVDFGGGFNRNENSLKAVTKFTKQSDFQLLHLSILREYLNIEFCYGLDPSSYDLEKIIDDFTFLTFLVGNDFLPHMPTLDIGDGAFDLLFDTYKEQRPTWGEGEYLTNAGNISCPARLEAFLKVIGQAETDIFEMREENEAKYLVKKRKWDKRDRKAAGPTDEELAAVEAGKQGKYEQMIADMIAKHGKDAKFVDGWSLPSSESEEGNTPSKDFKGRYYYEKLYFTPVHIEEHLALRKSYIEGLQWCLAYYYRGCISWGWFYPYHYGPLISDLTNLEQVFASIKFEEGEPLKPFEQLMGCLPPASAEIVPKPYRKLMCSPDSPILEFYPEEFEVDMNGKKNPWEGVNILPFIDVNLLKKAIGEHCPDKLLSVDERRRNAKGKVYMYSFDDAVQDTVPSFNRDIGIMDIAKCCSRVQLIEGTHPTNISFKPELIEGTQIPYPGFPSLGVLPMKSAELIPIGLNCFGSSSKYATTVLTMQSMPELPGAEQLADNILGKHLFINWPMMHEAKVVAVTDASCSVRIVNKKKKIEHFKAAQMQRWEEESDAMKEQYKTGSGIPGSGGVDIGDIQIRLKLLTLQGMKTSSKDGSSKKVFGTVEADVPLQMVLWQSPAPDPRFEERGPLTLKDRFPSNSAVVLTKGKFRGCQGSVVGALDDDKVGVKVQVTPPEPPFGLAIARSVQESYISSSDASKVLKIHPGIFGKIVGSLFFNPGRYDLGLNLRYKQEFCTLGYTRRKDILNNRDKKASNNESKKSAWGSGDTVLVVGNQRSGTPSARSEKSSKSKGMIWEYTPKAIRLVAAYKQQFPKLFAAISKSPNERSYDATILGPSGDQELKKIREWLNSVETASIPRTPCTTEAMPAQAITAVQRAADVRCAAQEESGELKEVNVKVPASAIYREGSTAATDIIQQSDTSSPELGDRIVNLCANGLPFAARGTVVGIHDEATGCVEVVMDKEFIGGSTLQGSCGNFRGKLVIWNHLLKVSASNSMEIVDQMIPAGTGKASIQSLLKATEDPIEKKSEAEAQPKVKIAEQTPKKEQPKKANPPNAWGVAPRSATPSKDKASKQAGWREAQGPPGTGIGFKGAGRKVKNGYQAWKKAVKPQSSRSESKKRAHKANGSVAVEGLKAMLGVKPVEEKPALATKVSAEATSGLKNMLGIASALPDAPAPKETPSKPNAAAALLAMMNQGPPATNSAEAMPPQQPVVNNGFNFTYVKEGEAPPVAPPQAQMPMYPPTNGMMPLPPHLYPGMMPPVPMMGMGPMMSMQAPMGQPATTTNGGETVPVNRGKKEATPLVPTSVKSKK